MTLMILAAIGVVLGLLNGYMILVAIGVLMYLLKFSMLLFLVLAGIFIGFVSVKLFQKFKKSKEDLSDDGAVS
jgi:H+/Cl- antiporter ClcA